MQSPSFSLDLSEIQSPRDLEGVDHRESFLLPPDNLTFLSFIGDDIREHCSKFDDSWSSVSYDQDDSTLGIQSFYMAAYGSAPDLSEWEDDNTGDGGEFLGFESLEFEKELDIHPLQCKEQKRIKRESKKQQRAKRSALLTIAKKKYRQLFPSDRRFDRHILAQIQNSLSEDLQNPESLINQEEESLDAQKFALIKVKGKVIKGIRTKV